MEIFGPRRDLPKWEWLSALSQVSIVVLIISYQLYFGANFLIKAAFNYQERKWLPAMGYVGDHLTLAGGGDYGDETVS